MKSSWESEKGRLGEMMKKEKEMAINETKKKQWVNINQHDPCNFSLFLFLRKGGFFGGGEYCIIIELILF